MTDILQRVEDMLIDCAIGPMRTLKTDDLTRVLYDASEEIVHLREKVAKITAQREDLPAGEIALAALREGEKR